MLESPRVIYEDDQIIALCKPAGMPSASLRAEEADTLAAWLLKEHPHLRDLPNGELEAGLLHRLDNDTSGVIVAAKTLSAYKKMKEDISAVANKNYLALVVGFAPDTGKIDAPIAHHPRKKKKMLVCAGVCPRTAKNPRPATTLFKSIARFNIDGTKYTLLLASIKRGVRHQIRAHLASAGYPISGDVLYMNAQKKGDDRLFPQRQLLHAHSIEFYHPEDGRKIKLFAAVAKDMKDALIGLYRAQKNLRVKAKARIRTQCKKHTKKR